MRPLVGAGTLVGGLGGEIGRGFFWRTSDAASTHVGPETIVGRFGMPSHPQVLQAVARWYPSVTVFDPFLRLDLAYLELRMGCWAFAQAYVLPEVPAIHPMISRRAFASMLALPVEWRRNGTMIRTAIAREWPELLDLPINRYGDYRDTLRFVERAVRQPHLVLKKARKLFA